MSGAAISKRRDVVIVGGGIAGLAAAHRLAGSGRSRGQARAAGTRADAERTGGEDLHITLLEADERLGGKIRTETFAGRPLDVGAEALLARVPAGLELCRELGLDRDLLTPANDQPFVWSDRLRPLPPRLLAGVPDGFRAVIASGILSPAGLARAGLDLIIPARPPKEDVSIGSIVRRRLGAQTLARLIDPLLGGIHAGSCDELSVRAVAPQLEAALRKRRSLVRGLRALSGGPPRAPAAPAFLTLSGGLEELVDALRRELGTIECRTGTALESLRALPGGGARLMLADGDTLDADHVILALPSFAAATLTAEACPQAAAELEGIPYASVATIALSYPSGAFERPLEGSGFLVTRTPGRTITACTWSSVKWPHMAGETVLLKCSAGHAGNERALELDDEQLVAAVRADLGRAMNLHAAPLQSRVFRFERALPQYEVGHLERIARIEAAMQQQLPGVSLCGAAYRGVGVASCIRDGRAAADAVAATLRAGAAAEEQRAAARLVLTSN
jgi:oxygen-dependent protoporphyrinogen oxidase